MENNKVVFETQWIAVDSKKEYPHGWGFVAPLVEFPQDKDPVECSKTCMKELSNDEFECTGAIPRKLLQYNIKDQPPKETITPETVDDILKSVTPDDRTRDGDFYHKDTVFKLIKSLLKPKELPTDKEIDKCFNGLFLADMNRHSRSLLVAMFRKNIKKLLNKS